MSREDDNVRILATQEIEKREYVRPKPTRQEIEKKQIERVLRRLRRPQWRASAAQSESEKEKYWAQHEQPGPPDRMMTQPDSIPDDGFSKDGFSEPAPSNASPVQPSAPPPPDYRRRQSLAGLQSPERDSDEGAPPDPGTLPRISPEAMPGLLSASMEESGVSGPSSGPKIGAMDAASFSPYSASSFASRSRANSPVSPYASTTDSRSGAWTPRLDTRTQRPLQAPADDRGAIRRRVNPYAEVPSLYDLNTQFSRQSPVLVRFGEDVFRNGTGNFDELPMDLPVGTDYVLGPGDALSIELWGGISQRLQRVVDREGRVALPEAGAVEVNGRSLGDVQQLVQATLRSEFRDVHADVSGPPAYGAGLRGGGRAAAGRL